MNKPAPKEPSMDEILSSIRQIIADDDAAVTTRRPSFQTATVAAPMTAKPAALVVADDVVTPLKPPAEPISFDLPDDEDDEEEGEPLTLSAAQMLPITDEAEFEAGDADLSVDALLAEVNAAPMAQAAPIPQLVDPEDIAFEPEDAEVEADAAFAGEIEETPQFGAIASDFSDVLGDAFEAEPAPAVSFEAPAAAPLPDPTLSAHLAEQLLEPTTEAVVRSSFSRLNPLPLGNQSLTVESMMREMLRPMLKEWLDENLPTIVERMVEKEIARVSRGVE